MKALLLTLALVAAPAVAKPPPCWPRQAGSTGSDYKIDETPKTVWIGWVCMTTGKPTVHVYAREKSYAVKYPPATTPTTISTLRAFWSLNVTLPCSDPRIAEGCAAAFKAFDGGL